MYAPLKTRENYNTIGYSHIKLQINQQQHYKAVLTRQYVRFQRVLAHTYQVQKQQTRPISISVTASKTGAKLK